MPVSGQVHELYFKVLHENRVIGEGRARLPFQIGRRSNGRDHLEPEPVVVVETPQARPPEAARKIVIAPLQITSIPRKSAEVDVDDRGRVVVRNIHRSVRIQLDSGQLVAPSEQAPISSGDSILFRDDYQVRLSITPFEAGKAGDVQHQSDGDYHFLEFESHLPSDFAATRLLNSLVDSPLREREDVAVRLVSAALEAFREPPGSDQFYAAASRAAVQVVDVDRVLVLKKVGDDWTCRAESHRDFSGADRAASGGFSLNLLAKMEAAARTVIVEPSLSPMSNWASMTDVARAVASPIVDAQRQVVGALYGERKFHLRGQDQPIGRLEAALLEVLASGISSSLAIEEEQRLRSSMSQFFSPGVVSHLERDLKLLESRESMVSVLFCDVQGFSAVTERVGPSKAIAWIHDILTTLSECATDHDGVLVDYVGDELMAMWGAPVDQPDHATRASHAALAMIRQIAPLRERWGDVVGSKFGLGIGICSGTASVGNTGSKMKFKYGPLGNTVNVASRLQGMTKQFGVSVLISSDTAVGAKAAILQTRRLGKVRPVGMQHPVELYQLCVPLQAPPVLYERFEDALQTIEQHDLHRAASKLASLAQEFPEDTPTIILLRRVVEALVNPAKGFEQIWNLTEK